MKFVNRLKIITGLIVLSGFFCKATAQLASERPLASVLPPLVKARLEAMAATNRPALQPGNLASASKQPKLPVAVTAQIKENQRVMPAPMSDEEKKKRLASNLHPDLNKMINIRRKNFRQQQ
jgi:hypothetical protein